MENKDTTFPALRCKMGDWVYYQTFFSFSDVRDWIKRTDQIHRSEQLRDMIQRALTDNVDSIVDYLIHQKEYFFSSIVVGVYGGAPQWFPIEVQDSPVLGSPGLDQIERQSIGVLKFQGDERLFAIDGQHRVEGIKKAIQIDPRLKAQEQSVILLAHEASPEGQRRTRRLFTTLNKWAKPVSKADIIALDEDDAFAIVTRRLMEEFRLLRSDNRHETRFVHFGRQPSLNKRDDVNLTTIRTVYDICSLIHLPFSPPTLRQQFRQALNGLRVRPSKTVIDEIYRENTEFWESLVRHFAAYHELFSSQPEDAIAGKYRRNGHLMFRPIGQKAFASAVRMLKDNGLSTEESVANLAKCPMQLDKAPWVRVLWDANKRTVVRGFGSKDAAIVMLAVAGMDVEEKEYRRVLTKYRSFVGDEEAVF